MKNNGQKIGISTVYTGYNYGSALQAFATKTIIKSMGMTPELLKLGGSLVKGRDVRIGKLFVLVLRSLCHSGGIKNLKNYKDSISKVLPDESVRMFDEFTNQKLCPVEMSNSKLKKRAHTDEYLAFLCGSDQIWDTTTFYVDPFYYLRFAPEHKRIAFAPSFGREYVADYNKKKITKYLSQIPYKSVRESSGVDIIEELTGDSAKVLIDPTLVLNSEKWRKSLGIKEYNGEKYLLAYFLDEPSELALQTVKRISEQYGLKVVGLPYETENAPWDIYPAGPREFVQYVSGASFVCTDSFHGTAFSVNFNVPFYTFERNYGNAQKQSTRIESLLSMLDMKERFNPEISAEYNTEIDFDNAGKVLDEKRNEAYSYLYNTVNNH